jgi:polyisoprenyl-phosphate glycosyltransferase
MQKKLISFVIPVYNEQKGLSYLFNELLYHTATMNKQFDFEIIFVNDGSIDESWSIIKEFAQNSSCVKGICFSQNFGYQYALTAGYDYAQGDAVITMDSDMQHPPSLIIKMVQRWQEGFHIVYAKRINRNDSFLKKFTALCYYAILQAISTTRIPRNISDFRLLDKQVVIELRKMREKARYLRGLVAWIGFNYSFVNYEQPTRLMGTTKYTWSKLFKIALDGIIGLSKLFTGIFCCSILLLLITAYTTHFFVRNAPMERATLLLLFFSLIMACVLVFTAYMGKHLEKEYIKALRRPLYIIAQKINC